MHAAGSHSVEKLTEDNFESWRMQMKSVLIFNELWGYVDSSITRPTGGVEEAAWIAKDEKALALIVLSISKGELGHIRRMTTSKSAWDELIRVHSSQGPVKKVILYRQLYNTKKDERQTMMQYINEFQNKVNLLEDTGIEIPEELKTIMLLNGLPDTFEIFCIAIESRDQIPGIDFIKGKLLEEEARRENGEEQHGGNINTNALLSRSARGNTNQKYAGRSSSSAKNFSHNKNFEKKKPFVKRFNGKCYHCDRFGHQAKDCRRRNGDGKANHAQEGEEEETAVALSSQVRSVSENEWYLDSGASAHMCSMREFFENINTNISRDIRTAGKETVKAIGSGTIKLNVLINGKLKIIKLIDVLYVPDLRGNLLSVLSIANKGFKIEFNDDGANVLDKTGSVVLNALRKNKMYVVNVIQPQEARIANSSKAILWHKRYRHLNYKDLKLLHDQNAVIGLDLPKKINPIPCKQCDSAKIHCLPFPHSNSRTKEKLELIHSDICGPLEVTSIGGAKYFATFIDDKTRHIDIAFLKSRSEIFSAFKKYKLRVENEIGRKIIKLRTDNAKEYTSRNFSQYLEEEGIGRQFSVEYTPQQNGIAERANRTLVEMARSMLLESNLPKSLWAEAINTAVFLRNRCPTKIISEKTPEELWSGRKPNVKFLRAFGSDATVLNKGPGVSKLDAKGFDAVVVGYSNESKAYRLWKRGTNTVIKSRDVRINEENIIKEQESVDLPLFGRSRIIRSTRR